MVTVGQVLKYNGKSHKVIKIEPDRAQLKCLECGGKIKWVELSKLP